VLSVRKYVDNQENRRVCVTVCYVMRVYGRSQALYVGRVKMNGS
jgi:hypothetical protein